MINEFELHLFFLDGEPPESAAFQMSTLSQKWLAIGSDLLDHYGPVFRHNMGGHLSHFDIGMAGPQIRLFAHGQQCFYIAVSLGTDSKQDKAAADQFGQSFMASVNACGNDPHSEAIEVISRAPAQLCALSLDVLHPSISDDDKVALAQLGNHLVGAYMLYCKINEINDKHA